jgi:uncharacterized protein (TIGR03067 family)
MRLRDCAVLVALASPVCAAPVLAQAPAAPYRMVDVGGTSTRVLALGLDRRTAGQPVVILMAGFGDSLESWGDWPAAVAKVAPVVAYDRPGIGGSKYDGRGLSPARVAEHLDELLKALQAPPPYVLVGHSWGGPLAMYYAGHRGRDIVGMVYLDPKLPRATLQEYYVPDPDRLRAILEGQRRAADSMPPGPGAEMTAKLDYETTDPSERGLPDDPPVPTAIVIGAKVPPVWEGAPSFVTPESMRRSTQRRVQRYIAWIGALPDALVIASTQSGHYVFIDVPDLSTLAVRHVVEAAAARRGDGTRTQSSAGARDPGSLTGKWELVRFIKNGTELPSRDSTGGAAYYTFTKDGTFHIVVGDSTSYENGTWSVDTTASPRSFDHIPEIGGKPGPVVQGIYEIVGDTLTVSIVPPTPGAVRPTQFRSSPEDHSWLMVLTRVRGEH